jgi:ribosome-associated protein
MILETQKLTDLIVAELDKRKAYDILTIDVTEKTSLADCFIIASRRSTTQVIALAEHVEEEIEKKLGLTVRRREGVREGRWAVLDYGDVIVHLFNDETRLFYHLERLWQER